MIEAAIRMLAAGLGVVLEFLGLEALADRVTREKKRDPRNFSPPR